MTNLKVLRTRIKTITSTQKITAAMKMVAATKLRRTQELAENARPYSDEVRGLVETAICFGDYDHQPKLATGSDAPSLLILYAADRGLCGNFDTNMFKAFRKKAQSHLSMKENFYCIGIGHNAHGFLEYHYKDNVLKSIQQTDKFNAEEALTLSMQITEMVNAKEIGRVEILYTQFKSMMALIPTNRVLVPLAEEIRNSKTSQREDPPLFEPDAQEMLTSLLQLFMSTELYSARLQSNASEQAARMISMDNATKNAQEMAQGLKLTYNKTRQSVITRELIEIISGAQSTE